MFVLALTGAAAFLISLLGRILAEKFLVERIPLIGAFAGLSPTENAGVAFGIAFPALVQTVLIAGALFLVLYLAYQARAKKSHAMCFGLILGGALANIFDRFDDGLVTDFFQVGSWPTFNVADSCITVGVGILLLWEILGRSHGRGAR